MICSKEKIEYGKQIIDFELYQEDRNSLSINVLPNSDVKIKAPINKNRNDILEKIKTKAKWIIKQQNYFEKNYIKSEEKKYINGETHLYLGKQYRLKSSISDNISIKLKNGYFYLEILNDDKMAIKTFLNNWYKNKAKILFEKRLDVCFEKFKVFKIKKPQLKIRKLKKRWGSYNKNNNTITINIDSIKASTACIDYIILHELCHCIYYAHNKNFYELLTKNCFNWQHLKYKLENYVV